MSGWDSYRAVYGAELRAAAHELDDHGWPVVAGSDGTLLLLTGGVVDVLEVTATRGRAICGALRDAGAVVPVAATPTGSWWFPVTAGPELPAGLAAAEDVVWHTAGDAVPAPPSVVPDGWVHWRVAPSQCGFRAAEAGLIFDAATDAGPGPGVPVSHPGAQRPAGVAAVGMRS